jgi:putative FmdB family regulatory protein
MPMYAFICSNCGEHFDLYFSYDVFDTNISKCPKCGSEKTHKNYFGISVHYKGEGFTKKAEGE